MFKGLLFFINKKLTEVDFENLENPDFLDMKPKAEKFLYGDWHGFSYVLDCALNISGQAVTLTGIIVIVSTLTIYIVALFVILVLASSLVESRAKKNELKLSLEQATVERGNLYYSKLFEGFSYGKEIRLNGLSDWLLSRQNEYLQKEWRFINNAICFTLSREFLIRLHRFLSNASLMHT